MLGAHHLETKKHCACHQRTHNLVIDAWAKSSCPQPGLSFKEIGASLVKKRRNCAPKRIAYGKAHVEKLSCSETRHSPEWLERQVAAVEVPESGKREQAFDAILDLDIYPL